MSIFLSSDHHFYHGNIIKYCDRPFLNIDHMNLEMIERWNATITNNDIVLYLGDLSAGLGQNKIYFQDLIRSLNGKKILIRGNHDHQTNDWYIEAGFKNVFDALKLGNILLIHYTLETALEKGMNLTHLEPFDFVVHGHTHRLGPNLENHFNVAADRHNFTPIQYENVVPQNFQNDFLEDINKLNL